MLTGTVCLSIGHVTAAVRIDPPHHVHVVGDERWNLTLENRRVPAYRELIVNLNFKVLGDHCNEANRERGKTIKAGCTDRRTGGL